MEFDSKTLWHVTQPFTHDHNNWLHCIRSAHHVLLSQNAVYSVDAYVEHFRQRSLTPSLFVAEAHALLRNVKVETLKRRDITLLSKADTHSLINSAAKVILR
ncbi:hypothetical protein [Alteromonas oceanisediminis]|uniref:hypothetical protein n=1 Tax=Alteromonas oceanisediminis TaxID=2836180 RepID=UPI001BD9232A|nr:hypothetical protein [Alteromonas oceanisediminis]MBT0586340.1 hypothetical protein [Alteromonas oceanisediminis]